MLSDTREKAIKILEAIAEKKGKPRMFDGEQWYEYEDMIVEILERKTDKP